MLHPFTSKKTEEEVCLKWFIPWTPAAHFSLHGSFNPSPVCWDGHQPVSIVLVEFVRWSKLGWKTQNLDWNPGPLCFFFELPALFLFYLFFQIRNWILEAGSSEQRSWNHRWFGLHFFWRQPVWGGTERIPGLVPAVPPRKNWPLALCGVESIELPWEAKHNTG